MSYKPKEKNIKSLKAYLKKQNERQEDKSINGKK